MSSYFDFLFSKDYKASSMQFRRGGKGHQPYFREGYGWELAPKPAIIWLKKSWRGGGAAAGQRKKDSISRPNTKTKLEEK